MHNASQPLRSSAPAWGYRLPLIRSIHEATLIFSLLFIIFNASSRSTSPVSVSSTTSITLSDSGKRRREESFCMLIRPRKASSMTMHPRNAYDMLSFQNERYPYRRNLSAPVAFVARRFAFARSLARRTCLSFSPISKISSISVSFGCLSLSALSLISRGSNAILCPFAPLSYDVSSPVPLSGLLDAGEATLLVSSLSVAGPPPTPPAPLLRVTPDVEAIQSMSPARGLQQSFAVQTWGMRRPAAQ